MSNSLGESKRGYEAVGDQKLDVRPDTKEGFYIGVEMDEKDLESGTFLKGPNFWPDALSDDKFRGPVMTYHQRVLEVHEVLLGILEEGLSGVNLMEDEGRKTFEEFRRAPVANLKLLHYPPRVKGSDEEESIGGMFVALFPWIE
jgi:isopenicillin N synthase-like dioxygenase